MSFRKKLEDFHVEKHLHGDDISEECLVIDQACFERDIAYGRQVLQYFLLNHHVFVARDQSSQNSIVGYIIYMKQPGRSHIASICVLPDYQRRHIGQALMSALLSEASLEQREVVLECRPYNEGFYRKIGFLPCRLSPAQQHYYHADYYRYGVNSASQLSITVPGISMKYHQAPRAPGLLEVGSVTRQAPDEPMYEENRQLLILLIRRVKASTSIFYGGFVASLFRSHRKELAFDAMIQELCALAHPETKNREINIADVIRSIASNAMIIRGAGVMSQKTKSAKALIRLLNSDEFQPLKKFVVKNGEVTYHNLKAFCYVVTPKKSTETPLPYSPYRYF